jgi:hypothetical protein
MSITEEYRRVNGYEAQCGGVVLIIGELDGILDVIALD